MRWRSSSSFAKVFELDPTFALAYVGRARMRREEKDFDGALADLDYARRIDSEEAEVHYWTGRVLKDDLGRWPDALPHFDRCLELDPNHAEGYRHRSRVYESLDLPQAIADLERAIELKPPLSKARVKMNDTLGRLKQRLAAKQ